MSGKCSSKELALIELQKLTENLLQQSVANNQYFEDYLNNLLNEIRDKKAPLIQRLLVCLIYPLIVGLIISVITPISNSYMNDYFRLDTRSKVKVIKKNASNVVTNYGMLDEMRFVNANLLNVRMQPSIKSHLIGTLKFSTPVIILKKKKNWTLVEWVNQDEDISLKGWVFSRYLKKFR